MLHPLPKNVFSSRLVLTLAISITTQTHQDAARITQLDLRGCGLLFFMFIRPQPFYLFGN